MTATVSLKALARLVLERDAARDGQRDSLSHSGLSEAEPSRQFETLPSLRPIRYLSTGHLPCRSPKVSPDLKSPVPLAVDGLRS